MDDFTARKVRRLRRLLADLPSTSGGHYPAKQFVAHLTLSEQVEYNSELARYRKARDEEAHSPLSQAARDYWYAFRDLCKRVNLARTCDRRNRLVDEAAELMEQFEALPPSDQGRFRTLNLSQGDTKWANALHLLEHELPFLDDDAARPGHLDHVENFTQREFLAGLLNRLDPPEQETSTPEEDALLKQRQQNLRDMIKRLRR